MKVEIRMLTNAELDQASGAEPNLGGYTFCWWPKEGLYVGGCQTPPGSGEGFGMGILQGGTQGGAGGTR